MKEEHITILQKQISSYICYRTLTSSAVFYDVLRKVQNMLIINEVNWKIERMSDVNLFSLMSRTKGNIEIN